VQVVVADASPRHDPAYPTSIGTQRNLNRRYTDLATTPQWQDD
jgi:hypothetical protein